MADQLYLSYRVRGYSAQTMVRNFEKLLRLFPYSRLGGSGAVLRVNAVSSTEPPLVERTFEDPASQIDEIIKDVREYAAPDCGVVLDVQWDLWQFEEEWKLRPARASLACFGPGYESEAEDHLRIDFGIDTHFLPQPDLPNYLFMARSNVRSLLHLVHELDRTYVAESRRLWTESGENFAERLQMALAGAEPSA